MLFPKFSEGLESVLFIALNSGSFPVSSKAICSYQDVLPRHLEPVLQTLVKENILKGTKGPRGGYTLAREKRKISVAEIFSILNRDAANKTNENASKSNSIRVNITNKIAEKIATNIESSLKNITIDDLCKQIEAKIKTTEKSDFNI